MRSAGLFYDLRTNFDTAKLISLGYQFDVHTNRVYANFAI